MWLILSVLAAVISAVAVIFQKKGAARSDVMHVGALCNAAAFVTMLLAVLLNGSLQHLPEVSTVSWMLSSASGLVQAFSWITFFMAMKDADVNAMMALDKLNIVATMILAWVLLSEPITMVMLIGTALTLIGSFWMANVHLCDLKPTRGNNRWICPAIVSPILMALSNIIAKMDTASVNTDLDSAVRMFVVSAVIGAFALFEQRDPIANKEKRQTTISLILGGVMIGISYLLMYRALAIGNAAAVTTIVKGSIIVTTILSRIFYREKLGKKGLAGFCMVLAGIVCFAF